MSTQNDQSVPKDASPFGRLSITFLKGEYSPGDQVNGIVSLILKKSISSAFIRVNLQGYEKVEWKEVNGGSSMENDTKSHPTNRIGIERRKINQLINHKSNFVLFNQQKGQPGSYSIPFNFDFPEELPASFGFAKSGAKAEICYKVIVQLWAMDHSQALLEADSILIIQEQKKSDFHLTPSLPIPLTGCFNSYKGNFNIKVNPIKRVVYHGEKFEFGIEVDNSQGKLPIKDITIKLHHYLVLSCDGKSYSYSRNIITQSLGSIPQGKARIGKEQLLAQLKVPDITRKVLQKSDDLPPDQITRLMLITLSPSAKSNHIDSQYLVEIECELGGLFSCLYSKPETRIIEVQLLPKNTFQLKKKTLNGSKEQKVLDTMSLKVVDTPRPPAHLSDLGNSMQSLTLPTTKSGTKDFALKLHVVESEVELLKQVHKKKQRKDSSQQNSNTSNAANKISKSTHEVSHQTEAIDQKYDEVFA